MLRSLWRMAVTGSEQALRVTLTETSVSVHRSESGADDEHVEVAREGLLAFSGGGVGEQLGMLSAICTDRVERLGALHGRSLKSHASEAILELRQLLNGELGVN